MIIFQVVMHSDSESSEAGGVSEAGDISGAGNDSEAGDMCDTGEGGVQLTKEVVQEWVESVKRVSMFVVV